MGRLTPQEIRDQEFKQSALGYSREQVQEFLEEAAAELETLIRESNEIHVENKELRLALNTYRNVEDSLKETLLLAQKTGQETMRNAQEEADTILKKARVEKDALLFSAKEDLQEIQTDIRELSARRSEMLVKLKSLLRSNLAVLEELDDSSQGQQATTRKPLVDLGDERIMDFSRTDLAVEDLPEPDEPEIRTPDTEDFSIE